jgi:hypothetical protein
MRASRIVPWISLALLAGCAKSAPSTATSAPTQQPAPTATGAQAEQPKVKQPRMGDSAIYVDGVSVGVLRALELPASLKPEDSMLGNGYERRRYGMMSYFKTLGLDPTRIKGAHFYGGRRVCFVPGDELRQVGDELKFSFTMRDRGKPRVHRARAMKANLSIDMLTGVVVYVDKAPPTLSEDNGASVLTYADGKVVTGVPYADEEQGNGTRLYVDGKLTATLKRKKISNSALIPGDDAHPRFSLAGFLDTVGVDAKKAKAVDLVAGDDVVARSPEGTKLAFTLPAKSQGKAVFEVPKASAGSDTASTRISAIQLYIRTTPPARTVTPPEQDDVPGQQGNGGGKGGQQDDEG